MVGKGRGEPEKGGKRIRKGRRKQEKVEESGKRWEKGLNI